jgi:hypothetical protein
VARNDFPGERKRAEAGKTGRLDGRENLTGHGCGWLDACAQGIGTDFSVDVAIASASAIAPTAHAGYS